MDHNHFKTSFKCSIELAEIDLEAMEIYRENITTAATNKVCSNLISVIVDSMPGF